MAIQQQWPGVHRYPFRKGELIDTRYDPARQAIMVALCAGMAVYCIGRGDRDVARGVPGNYQLGIAQQ